MKRISISMYARAIALTLCCVFSFSAKAQFSGSGSGTSSDPYLIFNAVQLDQIRNIPKGYFKMMADIDLKEWIADNNPKQGWLPIPEFSGTLDGNGKKITNFWINRPKTNYVGLFGTANGTIMDLSVEGNVIGNDYVGLLAGSGGNKTKISHCKVIGKIDGNKYIGGIIGRISDNSNANSVITSNVAKVQIICNQYGGGIVGYVYAGYYENTTTLVLIYNYSMGKITASNGYIGGICGYSSDATIQNNCAAMELAATADYVGGVIGWCRHDDYQTISDNYFCGTISGLNRVGGCIGHYDASYTHLCNNYANTSIIKGNDYVGGLFGYREGYGRFDNNVAINQRVVSKSNNIGRICPNPYKANNNRALVTTQVIANGQEIECEDGEQHGISTGKSTLKLKATYQGLGWDFDNVWEIQETESYPYHKWQTAPPVIETKTVSQGTVISGKSVMGGEIEVYVGDKVYRTTCTGNDWTVTTDPLQAGERIAVFATSGGKFPSYPAMQYVSYDGEGTAENPYKVFTAEDLRNITGEDTYYQLMNDIDLTDWISTNSPTSGWQPVNLSDEISVHLDGNGHTISGLWTNCTGNAGLFSTISNGSIKNLMVTTKAGKAVKGTGYVGVLAGRISRAGNVEQCYTYGTVSNTGTNTAATGGMIGMIAGNVTVADCYSDVDINTSCQGGGLIGHNQGKVSRCYANGAIKSKNIGAGVVGYNDGGNSAATSIVATNKSINVEDASGIAMRVVGGIKNSAALPEDCYALSSMILSINGKTQNIYDDPLNGTKKTREELKSEAFYRSIGWDMDNVWGVNEGVSYPYLRIFGDTATSVDGVKTKRTTSTGYYTIDGMRHNQPQRGINIVKSSDGTTRKMLVK